MDNLTSKKKLELFYFRRFKELLNEFPIIEPEPNEEPDFTIPMNDYTLGIEITRFFRPGESKSQIIQEQEKLHQYVADNALKLYEEKSIHQLLFLFISNLNQRLEKIKLIVCQIKS